MSLPDRFVKKLERELVKGRARQRADKKAVARRMRRTLSSHLATTSPSDVMEGVKETPIINPVLEQPEEFGLPGVELAILNASRVKKHKGRKAKNSSVSRSPPLPASPTVSLPSPPPPPPPPSPPPPPQTPTPANVAHLERKIARLEAELLSKDRGRQKRTDAYNSMKNSEHQRMLDLMDARLHIKGLEAKLERLEEELEETKRETVSWVHRAEKFKAERYQAFSHTIDPTPPPPPPSAPRAIEWGALVRQPEFWAGAVGLVTLLAAVYVAGRYQGDGAPTMSLSCPPQIPCPRPPRVESQWAQSCPKVECPRVECPRVLECPKAPECPRAPDCPTGSAPPSGEKCRGKRHLIASYAIGAVTGGISTWQTIQAMD